MKFMLKMCEYSSMTFSEATDRNSNKINWETQTKKNIVWYKKGFQGIPVLRYGTIQVSSF